MKDKRIYLLVASAALMPLQPRLLDPEKIPEALDMLDEFMVVSANDSAAPMAIEAMPEAHIEISTRKSSVYKRHYRDIEYKGGRYPPLKR